MMHAFLPNQDTRKLPRSRSSRVLTAEAYNTGFQLQSNVAFMGMVRGRQNQECSQNTLSGTQISPPESLVFFFSQRRGYENYSANGNELCEMMKTPFHRNETKTRSDRTPYLSRKVQCWQGKVAVAVATSSGARIVRSMCSYDPSDVAFKLPPASH